MTAAMDPYSVLGLQPGASQAEVKRAYRRLAKALHPDSAGERSLPAFLAVQDAYERLTGTKVRTIRLGGAAASPPGPAPADPGFREPWRADPARARAAREQAQARRGTSPGGTSPGGSRAGASTSGGATDEDAVGGRRSGERTRSTGGPRPSSGAGVGSARASASGSDAGSRRRRSTRKATMGSTSYDEARDSNDTTWAGASWYGPTSGEYWRVNPREYADPRKHGPEYQSRGRRDSTTAGEAWDPEATRSERADGPGRAAPASERVWTPPQREEAARRAAPDAAPGPTIGESLAALGRRLDREPNDPIRRLGYALVAWAPVGLAVAALVGGATGCTTYSAACTGAAPMIPWLFQAAILGLLLLLPRLARILATGTAAIVVTILPLTGLLLAIGGSGEPTAPGVLQALLSIVWIAGVGLGLYAAMRVRAGPRTTT